MDNTKMLLRLIKLFDIGLLGIYYFLGALLFIKIFNNMFSFLFQNKKYPINKIKTRTLILQLCIEASIISILAYFLRHFVRAIPFPLNGYNGYVHTKTKEINGGVVIAFSMITAFSDFKNRAVELSNRF